MKTIFKIPVLFLSLILLVSCGKDAKKEESKMLLKSEFMSIEIPEGYDSSETNDPKELFMLVKSMGDKGYVNFSIDYIDDDVFSLITNEAYINNAIGEESVSNWKELAEDLESYKHRQSVKYTFNSIGAILMRQDSFVQDDETVLFTLFQFVYDGKLFTCGAKSINTADKEYFDDYVEIMESIKF